MGGAVPVMPGMAAAAPRVDTSNPYSAIEATQAPRVAEPKAIKIEMSEEVIQAQKKGRNKVFVVVAVAAVISGFIGAAFGSGLERGKGADAAIEGAQSLAKEIDEANTVANKLSDTLSAAAEKLAKGEYPEAEVTELGGINIPFEGANLTGKGMGRFSGSLVTLLIQYTNRAQEANDQKERIRLILGGAKEGVTELLQQKTNPKVRWGVFVQPGPHGPWANMQPLPQPFLVDSKDKIKTPDGKEKDYDWPDEFKIASGKDTVTLKRYKSGEPTGSEPPLIPVVPQTESSVCPSTTIVRMRSELGDMQKILKGDQTPGSEKSGLLELGSQAVEQLKKIGMPG